MLANVPFPHLAPSMTEEEFWTLVGRRESTTIEFKEAMPKARKAQDPLVAFANSHGGAIILGVASPPPHRVVGCDWSQALEERIQEVGRDTQPPLSLDVKPVEVAGRMVVFCQVPPLDTGWAHTSAGALVVRAGPTNRTLMGQELLRFVSERDPSPAEDRTLPDVTLDDLREDLAQEYVEARLGRQSEALGSALRDLGFLDPEGRVRLAGLLMFGKNPQQNNRRWCIEFQRFEGSVDGRRVLRERDELTGPIPELVEVADERVYDSMRRDAVVRGLIREEVPEYPPVVVREALVNAVAHRDYTLRGAAVTVRIFDDAVEVESPGPLPAFVTVENLRDVQYSRNQKIMDALMHLGFVEEAGQGVDRMIDEMESALLQAPEFIDGDTHFLVRLRGSGLFSAEDRLWIRGFSHYNLSGHAKAALVYVRRHGAIRNEELRELRSLDREDALGVLQELTDAKLLQQMGRGRGTHYVLGEATRSDHEPASLDDQLAAILAHARRTGSIANADVRGLLGVERRMALDLLKELVRRGYLEPVGERRGRRYLPRELAEGMNA